MRIANKKVSLSILVARTDIPFMMHTIPHLVRMCNYDFYEKCLIIDTAPLSEQYRNRPGIGTLYQLRECCNKLIEKGVVDRTIDIDYSKKTVKKTYKKHFGKFLKHTHNFRGYPIYGSIFGIEAVKGDYVLHFDSDMLLHQDKDFDWIGQGIKFLDDNEEIMFVSPLSGPPAQDGSLKQWGVEYEIDKRGFYRFKEFTSRKYLLKKEKFFSSLPMEPQYISWKRRLASYLTGKSPLWNWEVMVAEHLKAKGCIRADLSSPKAWTLHTPDHGDKFIKYLPEIIQMIEKGRFPKENAGDYDLHLDRYIEMINREVI